MRWILTPGHSNGLISLLVDTDDGLVVIASDCVGPLPEYFEKMDLPEDFGPERDELLRQWERIRELDPHTVIPGHNPPVVLSLAFSTCTIRAQFPGKSSADWPLTRLVRYRIIAPIARGRTDRKVAARGLF